MLKCSQVQMVVGENRKEKEERGNMLINFFVLVNNELMLTVTIDTVCLD